MYLERSGKHGSPVKHKFSAKAVGKNWRKNQNAKQLRDGEIFDRDEFSSCTSDSNDVFVLGCCAIRRTEELQSPCVAEYSVTWTCYSIVCGYCNRVLRSHEIFELVTVSCKVQNPQ